MSESILLQNFFNFIIEYYNILYFVQTDINDGILVIPVWYI